MLMLLCEVHICTDRQLCKKRQEMVTFRKGLPLDQGPPGKTHHYCLISVDTVRTCARTHALGAAVQPVLRLQERPRPNTQAGSRSQSSKNKQQINRDLPRIQHACRSQQETGKIISLNSAARFYTVLKQFLPTTFDVLLSKLRNKEVSYHG